MDMLSPQQLFLIQKHSNPLNFSQ